MAILLCSNNYDSGVFFPMPTLKFEWISLSSCFLMYHFLDYRLLLSKFNRTGVGHVVASISIYYIWSYDFWE
jgi:hypothetical protein